MTVKINKSSEPGGRARWAVPPSVIHGSVGAASETVDAVGAPAHAVRRFEYGTAEVFPAAPRGPLPPSVIHGSVGAASETVDAVGAPAYAVRRFKYGTAEILPSIPDGPRGWTRE